MAGPRKTKGHKAQLAFEALCIEGSLLSPEWLSTVAQLQAGIQTEADYRIQKGLHLRDEIGRCWRIAQAHWADFISARNAKTTDPRAVSERFVLAFLRDSFGFTTLAPVEPAILRERTYPIGHAALDGRVPVVISPADRDLDALSPSFGDGSRRRNAFGLAQEYLNAKEEALWGIVSNGSVLRIVRDNASLTRPAWIAADLQRIFTEERYADFAVLWLLCHETRFGREGEPVTECALEAWRTRGREQGTRARVHLRRGVEDALVALGQGFLAHAGNTALRALLQSGSLSTKEYFNQLLRLVYRLIFVLTVEERTLLHPSGTSDAVKSLYARGYGLRRLRERSVKRGIHDCFSDLWEATKIVCRGLADGEPRLGLPALAGIFAATQCAALDASKLDNRALLEAVFKLAWLREGDNLSRVNWRDMGPEELGSVYESLLELVPQVVKDGRQFNFAVGEPQGNARRATGSYYTPESLVRVLLDSALEPMISDTIANHPDNAVEALLRLAIVDPACGSGHFLLATARRLAAHVAHLQANGTPSNAEYRHALRQVFARCIFGIDSNPMAIELCKVGLWMEAVEEGLPLTFLDSHIQHGNALLGATPERMAKGIPDMAWDAMEGEDKSVARTLKKRNRIYAVEEQVTAEAAGEAQTVTRAMSDLDEESDTNASALAKKEEGWDRILRSPEYRHQKIVADAWCAAFFWPKVPGHLSDAAPTNEAWRQLRDRLGEPSALMLKTVTELAQRHAFFHWHLQFPQVFARGGFDVVIGNPPWIAHAGRAAQPLPKGVRRFYNANYEAFADYRTTHGLFASVIPRVLRSGGTLCFVLPSSLAELDGYAKTRAAHDRLCEFTGELTDFGEGCFEGVTQPCMALVSRRSEGGRRDAEPGEPWPVARPELTPVDRSLLRRLLSLPTVPPELFGDRGIQSDKTWTDYFIESREKTANYTTPIREGTDVREFELLPPRIHVDRAALGNRIRSVEEFANVRVVVRQTARYPIAALSDGLAFRNSLLAAFELHDWPAPATVALLNSALIRWLHYQRFRDARQPIMPQVKISHLRSIPIPREGLGIWGSRLCDIGKQFSMTHGQRSRKELDELVAAMYGLSEEERAAVNHWHQRKGPLSI
ncbi:MAG: N-6 DNA methylase [Polyangiaceae bacterium]|nr:N-6 DNA methylase [Polyangiaceae bacterium]